MEKQCLICGKTFIPLKFGEARKYCFECSPSYRTDNATSRAQGITALRRALKQQLIKEAGGKCVKCGYDKCPAVLEFHHLNPEEKEFSIADFTSKTKVDLDKARDEIKKCVLLCANCHREFHYLNDIQQIDYKTFIQGQ